MTNKEKAQLTYKALQKRKEARKKKQERDYNGVTIQNIDKAYKRLRRNKRIGQA
ncbi:MULTISPECIES: hypothetical protein [Clostridium]|uniref:hypothetical protein n=1 Tax=Clostridium TaxID=1485 RepID=UPI0004DA1B9F|nr:MULTISPECIES: hypothetical protein [Clostridium]KEI08039.1 hypothetical protein Z958_p0119 [Clostridium novyi B str. NCTC 9691]MCD3217458.1 hypothetical protein [Clostridium botulinum C]